MKRLAPSAKPGKGGWSCPDTAFHKTYPKLAEFLCDPSWDDGKPRDVGSMTIRLGGDQAFVSLTDYEAKASLFVNGDSLQECYQFLEECLAAGTGKWRRWKK